MTRLMRLSSAERASVLQSLTRVVELMEAQTVDAAPILTAEADMKPERDPAAGIG